jgi:hypothetical protein
LPCKGSKTDWEAQAGVKRGRLALDALDEFKIALSAAFCPRSR